MVEIVETGGNPSFRRGGARGTSCGGCFSSLLDLEHYCFEVSEAPLCEGFGLFGFFAGDFAALGKGTVFDEGKF